MNHPRALAGLALALLFPALLTAQEKPTPQSLTEISGTWRLDESRSDPAPGAPAVTPPRQVAETSVVSGVATGRGADAGAARAAASGPPPTAAARGGGRGRGGQSPYMRQLLAQMQSPPILIIHAAETTVSLAVPDGQPTEWPTTGKKRQKAQLDGTLLEFNGRWERDKLTLSDAIAGTAELKREFKVEDHGRALEVKYSVSGSGMPRKIERKVVYTRVE